MSQTRSSVAIAAIAAALIAGCASTERGGPPPVLAGQASNAVRPGASLVARQSTSLDGARPTAKRAGTVRGWMQPLAAGRRLVYISDFMGNSVAVLNWKGALVGAIGGLTNPSGIFVDAAHNLWVTNTYANNVLVYARGATTPSMTLQDPGEFPVDVSVCPDGTVYVANLFDTGGVNGNVSVYAKGAIKPTRTLAYSGQLKDYFITCDSAGNVFTTLFAAGSTGSVVEYPNGKQAGARDLGIPLLFPGGIKMDRAGNLLVNDQQARTLTEYTESGTPTGVGFTYGNASNDWVDIAVTTGGRIVAGADAYLNVGTAVHFPSGSPLRTFQVPTGPSGNNTDGIAFDPGQSGI